MPGSKRFKKDVSMRSTDKINNLPKKGQMVLYEDEEAEIISVQPLLIIKTRDRVVCGALHEQFECL